MSTSSFDDSSNLFDQSTAQNGEKKEQLTDEKEKDLLSLEEPSEPAVDETHHSKSKASRALKLLKRAKSPIREQLKAAKAPFKSLKNLPKHHHKSPKSPSKSPSKENLTEEYTNLEQKLSEKKSEEWKEFQQMQERIKQTVLKTQTSLHKFKDQGGSEKQTKWTGFDEQETLEPEEIVDVSSATPEINISWASYENDDNNKKLIDTSKDLAHLDTTPVPSPPITPAPPHNSRISSMENLMEVVEKTQTSTQEEVDLLGLGIASEPTSSVQTSEIMNQDLLGLDNDLLGTVPSVSGSDNEPLSYSIPATKQSEKVSNRSTPIEFDPNMTISDAESEFFLTQTASAGQAVNLLESFETKDKSSELDNLPTIGLGTHEQSATPDIIGLAQQTSDLIIPGEKTEMSFAGIESSDITKTDDLEGFPLMDNPLEPEVFKLEPTDQVVQQSMQTVQSSQMVLDDLSSLDPMKAESSSNVSARFGAPSAPINIVPNAPPNILLSTSPNIYGTSPQSGAVGFGSYPSSQIPIEHDIMSKIQKFSSSNPPVSPGRRKVESKAADPFSFVKKELKKDPEKDVDNEDDGEYKPLVAVVKPNIVKGDTDTRKIELEQTENIPNIENNPFLSGDFNNEPFSNEGFSGNCDVAAVFGVEPVDGTMVESGIPVQDALSNQQWTNMTEGDDSFKDTWEDMSETKSGFDTDMAWDNSKAVTDQPGGDAWASVATASTDENIVDTTDSSNNPFQDDFAVFHEKNLNIIDIGEIDSNIANVNPFLDENIAGEHVAMPDTTVNPFLDTESVTVTKEPGSSILDNESFFLDSLSDTKIENIPVAMDDDFDPFKVSESKEIESEAKDVADDLDLFANAVVSAEKQQSKSRDDNDEKGFVLEIKPFSERVESDTAVPAPALKPPPKPPKSPQPPRENPFDRDSPPEENFAQFEIKDSEKPKEPVAKSFSTESSTTEEEEVLEPLEPFLPKFEKEGFKLMLRYPTKKKITGNRYWKNVFVRVEKHKEGPMVKVLNDPNDALPLQELLLQACYSLSDCCLQQYDQYGKIHTVKLQYIFYKERVGIKTDRITPSLAKLRSSKPKANMIMDHSPQVSELLKFGSLDKEEIILFMQEIEDTLMNLDAHREKTLTYSKDEVTAELHDEYKAELDKTGRVLMQKARVRIFVLAFLTGMPTVELGLNDKRRRGKEVVGRNDIIPIKTEEWIRLEDVEFHCCVDKEEFEKTNNIKFHPLDACQFELLRYRVRLRENKELPMQLTIQQIFKERKLEVRCDLLVTGYHSFSKKHGQFPCEDIEVRFPMPENWIYLFRYERRFGYGAFKSTTRKPGKIKG